MQSELNDIKTHFYAIMEKYPTTYANFKMSSNLPSARDEHDKIDAALTSLHDRMFTFKAALEKELDDNEEVMAQQSKKGAQLNAKIARRTAILNNKALIISQSPSTASSTANGKVTVLEPFISGLGTQLKGCLLDASGTPTNCPCVQAGQNTCSAKCKNCPASANQLSLVAEARDIEKRAYIYGIFRIIYLVVGISMISFFIFKTVGSPDSTILNDAKVKADQLKTEVVEKTSNLINLTSNDANATAANTAANPTVNTAANNTK